MILLEMKWQLLHYVALSEVPTVSSTLLRFAQTDGRNAVEVRNGFRKYGFLRNGEEQKKRWTL
jgi:hypothetical protein